MNKIYTSLAALVLVACVSTRMVTVEGPLERQFDRVIERHDFYAEMEGDSSALLESEELQLLLDLVEVDSGLLLDASEPVLDRHDDYVRGDAALDQELELPLYLKGSAAVRSLLETASR